MSEITDAGELLAFADSRVPQTPVDLTGLTRPELETAERQLDEAIAAIEQILAQVPAGAGAVPPSGFTTPRGREIHARDPARFDRAYLAARRDHLKTLTYKLIRRMGELADPAFHARNSALADVLLQGLNTDEAPDHRAQREAHDHKQELLTEVYYVRSGQRPPRARSLAEIELATELAPCPACTKPMLRGITVTGAGTTWTAHATCASCGAPAALGYTTITDPATVQVAPDELGSGPSLQIRIEAFRAELARVLPDVDGDSAARARARLCLAEMIKLTTGPACTALAAQLAALTAKRA